MQFCVNAFSCEILGLFCFESVVKCKIMRTCLGILSFCLSGYLIFLPIYYLDANYYNVTRITGIYCFSRKVQDSFESLLEKSGSDFSKSASNIYATEMLYLTIFTTLCRVQLYLKWSI